MDSYLKIIEQIGEGAFSKLYSAYDLHLNKYVALKIEKNNNKKTLLKNEFQIYNSLKSLSCIPKIYNYIPNITNEKDEMKQLNCLEMELLGKNLILFKKTFKYYNNILVYDILLQCLNCIQKIHNFGFIHRDIKPSNFCLNKEDEKNIIINYKNNIYLKNDINVYLIDFGLVKKSKQKNENINEIIESNNKGFVGTLTYASLSAHNKEELSKRDDLWSFFFMLLDLLNEKLPWRNCNSDNEKEIVETKLKCINDPEKYLFLTITKNNKEITNIFNYIKNLKYETEPDYKYISNQLTILKNKEIQKIYYNEINNQIQNLQKNLMAKNKNKNINNNNITENKINNNNQLYLMTQQDYINCKLCKTNDKSIPSLKSTNYTSSIYYKTNYINCFSGNNNENFYQNVLKLDINNNKKLNNNINNISLNNKNSYNYKNNKVINIYPYKFQAVEKNFVCKNIKENKCNNEHITAGKSEKDEKKSEKFEDDKSLIEILSGNPGVETKNKEAKNRRINIHNKRKKIQFRIVKKEK